MILLFVYFFKQLNFDYIEYKSIHNHIFEFNLVKYTDLLVQVKNNFRLLLIQLYNNGL